MSILSSFSNRGVRIPGRGVSRGGNTLEQVAPNRRQIAVTSFDLLNGSFHTAARNRQISVFLLAAVVLGIAWQGAHALQNTIKLSEVTSEVLNLKDRQRDATARFSASSGLPEGVTEVQLFNRYELLTTNLEQVSVSSATPFIVLATVSDPTVTISSIGSRLRNVTVPTSTETSSTKGVVQTRESELLKGIKELEPGQVLVETTITATAVDVAALTRWAQRVRDAKVFNNIVIERSGTVYTLFGVALQDQTPSSVFTPWSQAGLPILLGSKTAANAAPGEGA